MSRGPLLQPQELAFVILGEAALLALLAAALFTLPNTLSTVLSHDPCTHPIGVCSLGAGYFSLRLARAKAIGGRRFAARLSSVVLLVLGAAWTLGDRFLWVFDALEPDANVRARGVAQASVVVGLCGLWVWRRSPLRR